MSILQGVEVARIAVENVGVGSLPMFASVPAARGSTKVATAKAPSESARPAEESAKAVAPAPATEASKVPAESAKAASDE